MWGWTDNGTMARVPDNDDDGTPPSEGNLPPSFEDFVLAIMARVIQTGTRIDLAVERHLADHPGHSASPHLAADLIICVSDCQNLMCRAAGDQPPPHGFVDEVAQAWRAMPVAEHLTADHRTVTRIQAGIGNIRRAIDAVIAGRPSPRS